MMMISAQTSNKVCNVGDCVCNNRDTCICILNCSHSEGRDLNIMQGGR